MRNLFSKCVKSKIGENIIIRIKFKIKTQKSD